MTSIYSKHPYRTFIILILLYGIGFGVVDSISGEIEQDMRTWPSTEGVIQKSSYSISYNRNEDGDIVGTEYNVILSYKYTVDGISYDSSRFDVNSEAPFDAGSRSNAIDIVSTFSISSIVEVYYHPEYPAYAVLNNKTIDGNITNDIIISVAIIFTILILIIGFPLLKHEIMLIRSGVHVRNLSFSALVDDLPKDQRSQFGIGKEGIRSTIEHYLAMDKNEDPEVFKYFFTYLILFSGLILVVAKKYITQFLLLFHLPNILFVTESTFLWSYCGINFIVVIIYFSKVHQDLADNFVESLFYASLSILLVGLVIYVCYLLLAPIILGILLYISMLLYMPVYLISDLIGFPLQGLYARYWALVIFTLVSGLLIYILPKYELTRRKGMIIEFVRQGPVSESE